MSNLLDAVADCLDSAHMVLSYAEALDVGRDHDTEGLDSLECISLVLQYAATTGIVMSFKSVMIGYMVYFLCLLCI